MKNPADPLNSRSGVTEDLGDERRGRHSGLVTTNADPQGWMSWLTLMAPFPHPVNSVRGHHSFPRFPDLRDLPPTQFTPSAPFDAKHTVKLSFAKHQNS